MDELIQPPAKIVRKPNGPNKHIAAGKLTFADLEAIARLVGEKRLSETQACLQLGISHNQWRVFKHNTKSFDKFSELVDKIRGARLSTIIDRIDDASLGIGMKQPDWRAAAWIAEKIVAHDILTPKQEMVQPPAPIINIALMQQVVKKTFDKAKPKQKVIEAKCVVN